MNEFDKQRLDEIRQQGANAYWDDIPFHDNPFICGNVGMEGFEQEFQAWADGWNQSDRELVGVKQNERSMAAGTNQEAE